jgi:hypothetical protein
MNSMVQIMVGDRVMLVTPKVADRVKRQEQINRERSIRLSRELKQAGLLPSTPRDRFTGLRSESYARPEREKDSRMAWHDEKIVDQNKRFQAFIREMSNA